MHIWLLDGSKNYLETGVPSYETNKLLEETRKYTSGVEHVHISHVTRWQQTLRVNGVPVARYPDLVLPRNMDLNTEIRPIPVLKILEDHGSVCMNSREGMARTANKRVMGDWLIKENLSYPKTINLVDDKDPEDIGASLKWPFFLKQAKGAEGSGVALCKTVEEFNAARKEFQTRDPRNPLLAQEAVKTSFGQDVRAFVIGGRVVATMLRRATDPNEVRANISLGGVAEPFNLPEHGEAMAVAATQALKLDYAGVDLLLLPNNQFTVCEVNRTADWSALEVDFPIPNNIAKPLIAHAMQLIEYNRR